MPTHPITDIASWVGEGARHLVARAVSAAGLIDEVLGAFRARYRAHPVIPADLAALFA